MIRAIRLNSPYHKKGLKGSQVFMQIGNKRGQPFG